MSTIYFTTDSQSVREMYKLLYAGGRKRRPHRNTSGLMHRHAAVVQNKLSGNHPAVIAGQINSRSHEIFRINRLLYTSLRNLKFIERDGREFFKCSAAENYDVIGLVYFGSRYFACTGNGLILVSDDGVSWDISADFENRASGELIAMAATDQYIMAITAQTDIFISEDGINWDLENFNESYENYYSRYMFTNLISQEGLSFFILGYVEGEPGNPMGIFSRDAGEVWQFVMFADINNKPNEEFMPISLNSLCMFSGQLLTACDGGRILTISDCIKCSTMSKVVSSDLKSITLSDDGWALAAGDNFEFALVHAEWMIQDRVTQGRVVSDTDNFGAIVIDARPKEEYDSKHIPGSVNIPASEVESRLPFEIPDAETELIFYCSNGVMAQWALCQAQQLGYQNVFNLGGLSDWDFETE